jgi:hypothetical protein
LYDYICQCAQKEFGKPFKSGSERGIKFKGWEKGENNQANVVVGYDGRTTFLSYYGPNTTTLNSFKKNHKAHITGLELGLETPFNLTEIQKQLKILGFHF